MNLIQLKSDTLSYIGKTYEQERYITEDKKYLITADGISGLLFYGADENGTAKIIYTRVRFFCGLDIIMRELAIVIDENPTQHTLSIHESQYKKVKK